jgi:hypothetical protein
VLPKASGGRVYEIHKFFSFWVVCIVLGGYARLARADPRYPVTALALKLMWRRGSRTSTRYKDDERVHQRAACFRRKNTIMRSHESHSSMSLANATSHHPAPPKQAHTTFTTNAPGASSCRSGDSQRASALLRPHDELVDAPLLPNFPTRTSFPCGPAARLLGSLDTLQGSFPCIIAADFIRLCASRAGPRHHSEHTLD